MPLFPFHSAPVTLLQLREGVLTQSGNHKYRLFLLLPPQKKDTCPASLSFSYYRYFDFPSWDHPSPTLISCSLTGTDLSPEFQGQTSNHATNQYPDDWFSKGGSHGSRSANESQPWDSCRNYWQEDVLFSPGLLSW